MISDGYRCKFCGAWIIDSLHCCEGKYESDLIEARYKTIGWNEGQEFLDEANIITINNAAEFYVGDSKMPDFINWLRQNGYPENKEAEEILNEVKPLIEE